MSYSKDVLKAKILEIDFKFREEDKKQYLINKMNEKDSSKKTVMLFMSVLRKIDKAEVDNGKEWHYFTRQMVDDALVELSSKSIITLQSYVSIIKDYLVKTAPSSDVMMVGYAYTIQLTKDDLLNPEKGYINKIGETMQYITEDELDEILKCKHTSNSSKALAILLFNGIKGESLVDVANIKSEDVDLKNGVIENEDFGVFYKIPEKYIPIFSKAMKEKVYTECDYSGNVIAELQFVEGSEYLIKRTSYKSCDNATPIDMNICNKRIKTLGKAAGNPHITPVSIYNSGLTLKLIEECGNDPTWRQIENFREKYRVKLSQVSAKSIIKILLDKITSPSV